MLSPFHLDVSVSVFLVEDHPVVRDGLRMLLGATPDFTVWGEAASGEDAVDRLLPGGVPIDGAGPDIVLSDMALGGLTGLDLAVALRAHGPHPPVLILSSHAAVPFERRVRAAGAQGYVEKAHPRELLDALRTVAGGGEHWHAPAP